MYRISAKFTQVIGLADQLSTGSEEYLIIKIIYMVTVGFWWFSMDLPLPWEKSVTPSIHVLPVIWLPKSAWHPIDSCISTHLYYIFNNLSFLQLFHFMKSWFWPYATSAHSNLHELTSALHTIFHSSGSYFINSLFQFTILHCAEVPLIFLPDAKKWHKMATFSLQAGPRTFFQGFPTTPCIYSLQSIYNLSLTFFRKVHFSAAKMPGCTIFWFLGLAEFASSKSKLYVTNCQFTVNALGGNISFSHSNWHQL